jgi:hypothetical protein
MAAQKEAIPTPHMHMGTPQNFYSNAAQLQVQQRIDTFFEIRIPPDQDDLDYSYSPPEMSDSTDLTPLASDLGGDTLLSFGIILSSDESLDEFSLNDGESISSEASRIGWDTA